MSPHIGWYKLGFHNFHSFPRKYISKYFITHFQPIIVNNLADYKNISGFNIIGLIDTIDKLMLHCARRW